MSIDRTFEISIAKKDGKKPSAVAIINCLLNFGWSLYSPQHSVIYTDVGDSDDFDFLNRKIAASEYFRIVTQKELNSETIAFSLFYVEDGNTYRVNVLIIPNLSNWEVVISPSDETVKMLMPDLNILDANWYFCKVLPPLLKSNILIETFSLSQY